jgi:hypothetical protein
VIKSSEVLEVFFLKISKMDRILLNSNKRYESENEEGTLSTGGNSVKKRKNPKYNDSYLEFGFTLTEVDDEERPQCVLCMKVLALECVVSKSRDYFS